LSPGADALLPLEDAAEKAGLVRPLKEVKKGEWIWPKGAGIRAGNLVNKEGMQLKPTDIAMLAKLGISHVHIYDKPRVLIVPTGNECVKRNDKIAPGTVYESNGLMVSLLVRRYGSFPTLHDIVPDNVTQLKDVLMKGSDYDLIVTIGGSSAGGRDLIEQAVSSVGNILFHGVALHPGNHMGTGFIENEKKKTPVIFLPGYTESCAVASFVFVDGAVRKLGHYPPLYHGKQRLQLVTDMTTFPDVRAVRKVNVCDGKARLIKTIGESSHTGTFGYVLVPEDKTGFEAGEFVEVIYIE
jgi:molybdopterin molybdotransferase